MAIERCGRLLQLIERDEDNALRGLAVEGERFVAM
jgi:hypothetical protein